MARKTRRSNKASTRSTKAGQLQSDIQLSAAIVTVVVLFLAAAFLPPGGMRLWGIDWFRHLRDSGFIFLLPAALLILHPRVQTWFLRAATTLDRMAEVSWKRQLLGLLGFAGFLFLAMKHPVLYPFLGDGVTYAAEVLRIVVEPDRATFLIKGTSLLSGWVMKIAALTIQSEQTQYAYYAVGVLAFATLAGTALLLLRRKPFTTMLLLLLPSVTCGGVLFYSGYIELYALQYTFLNLFFISAILHFEHETRWYTPAAFLLLAAAFGLSSVIYIIPLVMLLLGNRIAAGWKRPLNVLAALLPVVFAALGYLVLPLESAYLLPVSAYSVQVNPMTTEEVRYTVFSLAHLVDIVNVYLLNTHVYFVIVVMLLFRRRSIVPTGAAGTFFLLSGLAGLVALLFGNTLFGLARDWDLAMMFALPIAYAAVFLVGKRVESAAFRGMPAPLAAVAVVIAAGWISLNASGESAVRFAELVAQNRELVAARWTSQGYDYLQRYLRLTDNPDADEFSRRRIETGIDPLVAYDRYLGTALLENNPAERNRQIEWFFGSLLRMYRQANASLPPDHPFGIQLRTLLVRALLDVETTQPGGVASGFVGRNRETLEAIEEFPVFTASVQGTVRSPEDNWQLVSNLRLPDASDPTLHVYWAQIAARNGQLDTACATLERVLLRMPNQATIYLFTASLYEIQNRIPEAISTLNRMLVNCRLTTEREAAERKLSELERKLSELEGKLSELEQRRVPTDTPRLTR